LAQNAAGAVTTANVLDDRAESFFNAIDPT
jgi:hypothetical protein